MRIVFADACFWIAIANPRDNWHTSAKAADLGIRGARILTTDEVLVELLNFFNKKGPLARTAGARLVRRVMEDPNTEVVPQTRASFLRGIELYESRPDKAYSLPDCISMVTMKDRGITEVLTHDQHFAQEGFTLLIQGMK
jgi:predicted nucleic acid-binding protein